MSARRGKGKMPKRMFRRERVAPPPIPPGSRVVYQEPGREKMWEVLEEFVEPFWDQEADAASYRMLLNMGMLAWNVALQPEEERPQIIDSILGGALPGAEPAALAVAKAIVEALVRRKLEFFADNRRMIYSFELTDRGDDFHLTVASTI
ncbi:MAG: hypothetical protein ACYC61_06530 [Isosphaeraceae bacterium]